MFAGLQQPHVRWSSATTCSLVFSNHMIAGLQQII
jgi:hypothetical protein